MSVNKKNTHKQVSDTMSQSPGTPLKSYWTTHNFQQLLNLYVNYQGYKKSES